MMYLIPQQELYRGRGIVQLVGRYHSTAQWAAGMTRNLQAEPEPTKKPRHHDHLLQHHIRSPIRK